MPEKVKAFDISVLTDPRVYAQNRLPARAAFEAYPDMEAFRLGESHGTNPHRLSLNGLWRFHHAGNPEQILNGFQAED